MTGDPSLTAFNGENALQGDWSPNTHLSLGAQSAMNKKEPRFANNAVTRVAL